jgi:hypothetical protein
MDIVQKHNNSIFFLFFSFLLPIRKFITCAGLKIFLNVYLADFLFFSL